MTYSFRQIEESDIPAVIGVFNHYVEHSLSAFPDKPVGQKFADQFMRSSERYPVLVVETDEGEVVGFGFVHQYYPLSTLDRTGMIGYFIHPDHCGKGVGTRLVEELVDRARELGIDNLIAMASAHNEGSIRFHLKNGFREVGRFERVGRKFGKDVDQLWFQRFI